jgi:hypothetical protein
MTDYGKPDLTQHPPRSPRVCLGRFAHLPRLLDKARAVAAGTQGEYRYDTMMDRFFLEFAGIEAEAFMSAVKTGKTDSEMLAWVMGSLRPARVPSEIAQWTAWLVALAPATASRHAFLAEKLGRNGPRRDDIRTWCDHLDLDDYVSFGGKP